MISSPLTELAKKAVDSYHYVTGRACAKYDVAGALMAGHFFAVHSLNKYFATEKQPFVLYNSVLVSSAFNLWYGSTIYFLEKKDNVSNGTISYDATHWRTKAAIVGHIMLPFCVCTSIFTQNGPAAQIVGTLLPSAALLCLSTEPKKPGMSVLDRMTKSLENIVSPLPTKA